MCTCKSCKNEINKLKNKIDELEKECKKDYDYFNTRNKSIIDRMDIISKRLDYQFNLIIKKL